RNEPSADSPRRSSNAHRYSSRVRRRGGHSQFGPRRRPDEPGQHRLEQRHDQPAGRNEPARAHDASQDDDAEKNDASQNDDAEKDDDEEEEHDVMRRRRGSAGPPCRIRLSETQSNRPAVRAPNARLQAPDARPGTGNVAGLRPRNPKWIAPVVVAET